MKIKTKLIKINGYYYAPLPEGLIENFNENDFHQKEIELSINNDHKTENKKQTDHNISSIDACWEYAAKNNQRELFMNTVRPLLKKKLGYEYSEVKCEQKAKLLCQRFYQAQEEGKQYSGPYLIESLSNS